MFINLPFSQNFLPFHLILPFFSLKNPCHCHTQGREGGGGRLQVIPEGTYLSTPEDPAVALYKPSREMSCGPNIIIYINI